MSRQLVYMQLTRSALPFVHIGPFRLLHTSINAVNGIRNRPSRF